MKWEAEELGNLTSVVHEKYYSEFWGLLPKWIEYLASLGVARGTTAARRSSGAPRVWIECPWSVQNSPIGNPNAKMYLYFPANLAEKIVVLGFMPPVPEV